MSETTRSRLDIERLGGWSVLLPASGWVWLIALTAAGLLGFDVRRHHFESAGLAFGVGAVVFAIASQRHPAQAALPSGSSAMAIAAPMLVALGAFWWTLGLGPLSDDFVLQRWARSGIWAPVEWPHLRPLPLALWQIIFASGGEWPAVHGVNLTVHAVNAGLVSALAARLIHARAGLVAGVTFALFPTSTEAVAWSAGIFDLLSTLFVLAACVAWCRGPAGPRQAFLIVGCCLAGALSKETAFVIPVLLALLTLFETSTDHLARRAKLRIWTLSLVSTCALLAWRAFWSPALARHLDSLPGDRRGWKDLLVRPFAALAVPVKTDAGLPVEAYLASVALLILLGAVIFRIWARHRELEASSHSSPSAALIVGAGWVTVSALPLLSEFYVSPELQGGRYVYMPAAGFAILLSAAFVGSTRRVAGTLACLLVLLFTYVGTLGRQRQAWQHAAMQRDTLVQQAAALVRSTSCADLHVAGAPDNFKGAFVFREGLADALSGLAYNAGGGACSVRWDGTVLSPVAAAGTR